MLKKLKFDKILLLILLLGLGLRLAGSTHGFPFIFHPDEPAVVRSATGIRFDPNPAHFDWPHLHFYLNFIIHWLYIKLRGGLQILGLQKYLSSLFPLMWRDPLVFYFISRVFNAFLGAFTAIPVYLAGKAIFDRKTGLLAALALILMPYHVYTSPFALIDIPTAFWVAWAFYFSAKIFFEKDLKNYLWAGLFVGFAASTKYNGGLMALMVPAAHLLRTWKSDSEKLFDLYALKAFFLSGLFAILGFVLGTPYSILDFDTFTRIDGPKGALWQLKNVGKVTIPEQITQFIRAITFEFAENFGYVFIFLYTLTLIYAAFIKRSKRVWLILLPSVFMFLYISGFSKTRANYYISIYPLVALVSGYALASILRKLPRGKKNLFLVLVFVIPLWFSMQRVALLVRDDTRVQMYEWMQENVEEGDMIYYNSDSMNLVVEKFSKNETNREIDAVSGKGYVLIGLDNNELEEYKLGIHPDAFVDGEFTRVLELDSMGRKGPNIFVYVFGKAEEN